MSDVMSSNDPRIEIEELLDEFYAAPVGHEQLGHFESVTSVPGPYDALLNHHKHMTVTVESHYDEKVDVKVHRCNTRGNWYAREITLVTVDTKRIVQYGIVRLNIEALDADVWAQIESQNIPLGRVLIEHNVLREVQLFGLWRVQAGPSLAGFLRLQIGEQLFGRTALIYCDNTPAIELLEIVAPVDNAD